MFAALLLAATLSQSAPPWLTGESRPEDLEVWCVTFSPGDTLTEWWGHTGLVVTDARLNRAALYNYGMFSFDEGFVDRFLQGRLEFWVSEDSVGGTFRLYQYLNRDVRVQALNLLPEQAAKVARALAENVLPENRVYLYHHYRDNCSTRPRDIIDRALDGQLLKASAAPSPLTLRQLTRRYSEVSPVMSLVLDYLQNDEIDGPITQREAAFLPDELERQLNALQVTRPDGTVVPAVKRQWNVFTAVNRAPRPVVPPDWRPQLALVGTAFGALLGWLVWRGRAGRRGARWAAGGLTALFGLGAGVLGTLLFLVGAFTNQTVAHRNENLSLANPVTLALLPLGVMLVANAKRAPAGLRWVWTTLTATSLLGMALKVVPAFDQDNWNVIVLLLPINAIMAAVWWVDYRLRPVP